MTMNTFGSIDYQSIDGFLLDAVDGRLQPWSLMTLEERRFLHGLLRHFKPKKVLEVGAFSGAGSALILNALSDQPEARLYSVDILYEIHRRLYGLRPVLNTIEYMTGNHDYESHEVGFVAKSCFPEAGARWKLYCGQRCEMVLDEIGGGIDFVVLDAAHSLPGEVLDFLTCLPYTAPDCVFVLHDINVGFLGSLAPLGPGWPEPAKKRMEFSCRVLMNTVTADKAYPLKNTLAPFWDPESRFKLRHLKDASLPNIGAFRANARTRGPEALRDLFNCLLLPWNNHDFDDHAFRVLSSFLRRHYPEELAAIFDLASVARFYHQNIESLNSPLTQPLTALRFSPEKLGRNVDRLLARYGRIAFWGLGSYFQTRVPPEVFAKPGVFLVDTMNRGRFGEKEAAGPAILAREDIRLAIISIAPDTPSYYSAIAEALELDAEIELMDLKQLGS
jgi:predicted O-methyltransferase YrrM